MGFLLCDKLVALLLADAQINALREVLPQLPSSLAFVLSAFENASSSVITLMPIMPPVLGSLLKSDLDMATAFRLFLRDSLCIVDPAIMPNFEQIAALRAEQQVIEYMAEPQHFDGDRKIQLARLNALKQQHSSVTELLSELYDIEMYAAGLPYLMH